MSEQLAARLDLNLAWQRVKHDISEGRVFISHPYIVDLVDVNLEDWLENIRARVAEGEYQPASQRVCDVPKPSGAVRPGGNLFLIDHLIYSALIADVRALVQDAVSWGNPSPDFAYRLRANHSEVSWFENYFKNWKALTNYSISCIEDGCSHIVVADVAGYYEQVDIYTLRSDLNGLGVDPESLQLLEKCLHRWSQVPRRGLPQGFSASDILGKLYLNAVDTSLAGAGFRHCRYVDDFRIFCRSQAEAKKALILLTKTLRQRGLVIQTAKTKILTADEARHEFGEVRIRIDEVKDEFLAKFKEAAGLDKASISMAEVDRILAELESDEPVEVIVEAYRRYFIEGGNDFNKSLFRFLLRRLGSAGNGTALDHALGLLRDHPEETDAILSYAAALNEVPRADAEISRYLLDEEAVYPYQLYQLIKWRRAQEEPPIDELMYHIREYSLTGEVTAFLRSEARAALGKWGQQADLEALMHSYGNANGNIERAEIICSVARMEVGRRNGFLGQVAGDDDWCSRAARLVRTGKLE